MLIVARARVQFCVRGPRLRSCFHGLLPEAKPLLAEPPAQPGAAAGLRAGLVRAVDDSRWRLAGAALAAAQAAIERRIVALS